MFVVHLSQLTQNNVCSEMFNFGKRFIDLLETSVLDLSLQVISNALGRRGGVSDFPERFFYEGIRFNAISVTRGWVGVQYPGK